MLIVVNVGKLLPRKRRRRKIRRNVRRRNVRRNVRRRNVRKRRRRKRRRRVEGGSLTGHCSIELCIPPDGKELPLKACGNKYKYL